jgi:hypothetical protein
MAQQIGSIIERAIDDQDLSFLFTCMLGHVVRSYCMGIASERFGVYRRLARIYMHELKLNDRNRRVKNIHKWFHQSRS